MKRATVAIIGGGFCGALASIRLLAAGRRGGRSLPFGSRIVLVEPGRAGEGLAYRHGPEFWRLNVPAERMSAFVERPLDFFEWARARDPLVNRGDFLPRAWYGDYLSERLDLARRRSPRWLAFDRVRLRATGIELENGSARILLGDGTALPADRVLLALGNSPAAPLPGAGTDDVVADAWDLNWIEDLPNYVPRVLLVGTGSTMLDIALALAEKRPDVRITAISRHGLLPRRHEGENGAAASVRFDTRKVLSRGRLSKRLHDFRAEVAAPSAEADGRWREPLQQIRAAMPSLWEAAPHATRARFLRHLRAWWNVHRHRAPHTVLDRIDELMRRKRLEVRAGTLAGTRRIKDGIVVTWHARGDETPREELFDAVVNVSGPDSDPVRSTCPLVQSLLVQGLCRRDPLGLGWAVDGDGRLLAAHGRSDGVIYYVGPLLRAKYWEAIAVQELRRHVDRTARGIAASLATGAGSYLRRLAAPAFRRERAVF
jgi:uncharacterized NAD(P)/FAD-binding protein YdhS